MAFRTFGRGKRKKRLSFESRYGSEETTGKKKLIFSIVSYVLEILLVIGIAYSVTRYGVLVTSMNGASMEATLLNDDRVLVNKFAYMFAKPDRNDVIAYCQESAEHNYINIKRVIALPGEKIRIESGKVYINDKELEEKINVELMNTGGIASEDILLDDNEYFVLGDNRNNSQDSRFSNVGVIVKGDIIGKVSFRLNSFAVVDKINLKNDDESKEDKESE